MIQEGGGHGAAGADRGDHRPDPPSSPPRGAQRRLVDLAEVQSLSEAGDYHLASASPDPDDLIPQEFGRDHLVRSPPPRLWCPRLSSLALTALPAHAAGPSMPSGRAAAADPEIGRGAGRQDHLGDHHHRHRPDAAAFGDTLGGFSRLIQIVFGLVDRLRRLELLPHLLLLLRRSASSDDRDRTRPRKLPCPGTPALTERILLGGAPRAVAIANGTLAAAIGLGLRLWVAGVVFWLVGHAAAVWAAKRDPWFVEVVRRHLRYPPYLSVRGGHAQSRRIPQGGPRISPICCPGRHSSRPAWC